MKEWMKALKSLPQKSLSRRSLLGAGAVAAAGAAVPSLARVASAAGGGRLMAVRVENIHITTNVLPAPSATFFLTLGIITEVDGIPASGSFYCRGVFTDPVSLGLGLPNLLPGSPVAGVTFVEQRFRIDGKGTIIGSGDEGDLSLAVVGGTGRFTGVHGSYSPDLGLPIPLGTGIINFTFQLRRG